jgi:hypothetical protein
MCAVPPEIFMVPLFPSKGSNVLLKHGETKKQTAQKMNNTRMYVLVMAFFLLFYSSSSYSSWVTNYILHMQRWAGFTRQAAQHLGGRPAESRPESRWGGLIVL